MVSIIRSRLALLVAWGGRLSGFLAMPALAVVAPLAVLPVVSATQGPQGWAALAVGQSVGAIGSIIAGLDWPYVGPVQAVQRLRRSEADVRSLFAESQWTRSAALAGLVPVVVLVTWLTAPAEYRLEAVLMSVAVASNALTATWYYESRADARGLLLSEGVVRLGLSLLSLPLVWRGWLWTYPIALLLGAALSFLLNNRLVLGDWRGREIARSWGSLSPKARLHRIRELSSSLGARIASNGLYFGAVSVVAVLAHSSLARFSAFDRVQKSLTSALTVLPGALVSVAYDDRPPAYRLRRTMWVALLTAAACASVGVVVALTLSAVLGLIFSGLVRGDALETALVAAGVGLALWNRCLLMLVWLPAGRSKVAFRNLLIASLVGLGALAIGTLAFGVAGALAAVVISEVVVVVLNVAGVIPALWRLRGSTPADIHPGHSGAEVATSPPPPPPFKE